MAGPTGKARKISVKTEQPPESDPLLDPVSEYSRDLGLSFSGGIVYQ